MAPQRDNVLRTLAAHRRELDRFAVASLAVFGSVARDTARPNSDVDILVEFSGPIGLFGFVDLQEHLSALLSAPVDLVSRKALIPQLRDRILQDAISVG